MVHGIGVGAAVGCRARQHVVLVRRVADAVHQLALLAERDRLLNAVPHPRLLDRVAVEFGNAGRDLLPLGVEPWPGADPIARVHRPRSLRAQISHPLHVAATGRGGQRLAVGVGAREAAVVGAVPFGHARHEEAHWLRCRALPSAPLRRRRRRRGLLREHHRRPGLRARAPRPSTFVLSASCVSPAYCPPRPPRPAGSAPAESMSTGQPATKT